MNRRKIDVTAFAGEIMKAVEDGALLTTKNGDKVNSMAIGWGHIGRVWELPVFVAYVRTCRYTREMLDANPEFTVNIPVRGLDRKALMVCGTKSGWDMDKISEAGLTAVEPEVISVPAVLEAPLTLECRVICRMEMDAAKLPESIRREFYAAETAEHVAFGVELNERVKRPLGARPQDGLVLRDGLQLGGHVLRLAALAAPGAAPVVACRDQPRGLVDGRQALAVHIVSGGLQLRHRGHDRQRDRPPQGRARRANRLRE